MSIPVDRVQPYPPDVPCRCDCRREPEVATKLQRKHHDAYDTERPLRAEAPEREEPPLQEPEATDLARRDYLAMLRRGLKEFRDDHMTSIAAALAYYGFLAIPASLLIAVGVFSLLAGPSAIA